MTRRAPRLIAAAAGVVALGACSPQATIAAIFGPKADEATAVARCESNLDPGAVSPGGGNHGLFQINVVHRSTFERVLGKPWSEIYNPIYNTAYAKHLYDQSGWSPWTCRP